jgi:superfamily II DNA or RNA helicase
MPALACRVGSAIVLPPELRPQAHDRLARALSLPNPDYVQARRSRQPTIGIPPRRGYVVDRPDGTTWVPRGAHVELQSAIGDYHAIEYVDARHEGLPLTFDLRLEPRPYQRDAATALASRTQGVVVLPCAAGKTILGLVAMHTIGRWARVLVPKLDLVHQWARVVREHVGIEPGIVADGERTHGPITIGTVFSLTEEDYQDNRYGLVILDESHHVAADQYFGAMMRLGSKHRLALTATPDREDGQGPSLYWTFGPTLLERRADTLAAEGYLTLPEVHAMWTGIRIGNVAGTNTIADRLMHHRERNYLLATRIAADARRCTTLALTGIRQHCDLLAEEIAALGAEPVVLTARSGRRHRRRVLERMVAGDPIAVLATPLFDEGVDVPVLDRAHVVWPVRSKTQTIQRAGRLMRKKTEAPIIYDYIDRHRRLRERWRERRAAYLSQGMTIVEEGAL